MKTTRDFNWVINKRCFNRLSHSDGLNLFLLDTGTLIDLEKGYANSGDGYLKPSEVFDIISMQYPLIITPEVFREMKAHRSCKIGKRSEITNSTFTLMKRIYEESEEFLKSQEAEILGFRFDENRRMFFDRRKDSLRYDVHMAAVESFLGNYRKSEKDSISKTDEELLMAAFLLSQGNYNEEKIDCVNILSTDEHLGKTVKTLRLKRLFQDYPVRVIPTRNDLRSYLR